MTYKMNEEYRKVLTEMIGECWHIATWKPANTETPSGYWECSCGKRTSGIPSCKNRTFTADTDMMKVFRWLVDNDLWDKFCESNIVTDAYCKDLLDSKLFSVWIIYNAKRFCCLVAMAKLEGMI